MAAFPRSKLVRCWWVGASSCHMTIDLLTGYPPVLDLRVQLAPGGSVALCLALRRPAKIKWPFVEVSG